MAEFAISFPVQLLLVFGIMQMAFLYMSTLMVNFTAYRVARSAVVGEHDEQVDEDRTGADVVAQTLLAPLAGRSLGGGDPRPQESFVPGWGNISDSDYAAAKTKVVVETPEGTSAGLVTVIVEYNQELLFPGI
ncbi:MAG: TadE family protein [Planctomycetota bacterium]